MQISTSNLIGWIGTVLIVLAYYMLTRKKISAISPVYQAMNLFGAVFVGINVYYQQAWPALTLQIVWGAIALSMLIRRKKY
jgi:hypothetical protein